MSDVTDLDVGFCPICGTPVAVAQAVAVGDPIAETFLGAYENGATHVSVEAGEIRLYQHENGSGAR